MNTSCAQTRVFRQAPRAWQNRAQSSLATHAHRSHMKLSLCATTAMAIPSELRVGGMAQRSELAACSLEEESVCQRPGLRLRTSCSGCQPSFNMCAKVGVTDTGSRSVTSKGGQKNGQLSALSQHQAASPIMDDSVERR